MKIASHARIALLAPAVLALVACASASDDLASVPAPAAPFGSDAERLAVALADAHGAFARNDRARLADALRRVDALGARPLDEADPQMRQWRQAAGEAPPLRGRTLGPGYRSGELSPGRSEQIEQVFLSGKRASVAVTAPSNARLTLEIQDRREAPVCGRQGNPSHCQWVPVFTDRYRIRIANPGETAVKYFLVVE